MGVPQQPASRFGPKSGANFVQDPIARACSALLAIPVPLAREPWVKIGMAAHAADLDFQTFDQWSSAGENYNAADAKSTWRSFKQKVGGVTDATLFKAARENGWKDDGLYVLPSPEERGAAAKLKASRDKETTAAELKRHEDCAKTACEAWAAATPCIDHPYLARKGVRSYGLKIDEQDRLLLPLMDVKRNIWTLQQIDGNGKKLFLKDGRKKGNLFVLGKCKKNAAGREIFILCEGYATAASLHEATGHLVIMCVDSGNLKAVAPQVRQKYPDGVIVIAGDNDIWTESNPGRKAAEEAADLVGGLVALPSFTSADATGFMEGKPCGPEDWNDWHALHGLESVSKEVDAVLAGETRQPKIVNLPAPTAFKSPPVDGNADAESRDFSADLQDQDRYFLILGFCGDQYLFYHQKMRRILSHTAKSFVDAVFWELAPPNWWELHFAVANKFDKKQALDWIFQTAHKRGAFSMEDRVRGRGAWMDKKRVIFHHGDHLTVDGIKTELAGLKDSRYIYEGASALPSLGRPASKEEGAHLVNVAKAARWTNPTSALFLAGWTFLAPIGGILGWRPHIWVTGPAGAGKSSILDGYIGHLLGSFGIVFDGETSPAAVRQTLAGEARPVVVDEAESNTENGQSRVRGTMSLARGSSSANLAKVSKGTVSGKAMQFHVRSMFCLGSIGAVLGEKDSDAGRFALLKLRSPGTSSGQPDLWPWMRRELRAIADDVDWPVRLLARALHMLPVIMQCIKVLTDMVAEKMGGLQRAGDQYGTLLAGFWCFQNDSPITVQEARELVDTIDFDEYLDRKGPPDASRCLSQILGLMATEKGSSMSLRTLILIAEGVITEDVEVTSVRARRMLQEHGVTITVVHGTPHLAIIRHSVRISALLKGTAYATDWQSHLPRVEGYVALPKTSFGTGQSDRAYGFPMRLVLQEDEPPM